MAARTAAPFALLRVEGASAPAEASLDNTSSDGVTLSLIIADSLTNCVSALSFSKSTVRAVAWLVRARAAHHAFEAKVALSRCTFAALDRALERNPASSRFSRRTHQLYSEATFEALVPSSWLLDELLLAFAARPPWLICA